MPQKNRQYPAFPIPAVGAILLNADRVLLIQRGQPPAKGQWTLPGGTIEVGESPEAALKREVWEECQLDISVGMLATIFNKVIRDEQKRIAYHYLILDYLVRSQIERPWKELLPQPGSDVMDARWIALDELDKYDLTEGLLDVISNAVSINSMPEEKRTGGQPLSTHA
ncbi:hypothetical protein CSA56_16475 [candidate division KSB3 bacterium]|uniref:Nudix hydrolase domain-containing protein n=1 Tax=candidate division KSB3 bacterium TaxID=2044937 RepID=A0A2G6K958_9BACT|nr:MAG: hypothetical protein CSA56_16475 [candidate division KSB3 bacterium]